MLSDTVGVIALRKDGWARPLDLVCPLHHTHEEGQGFASARRRRLLERAHASHDERTTLSYGHPDRKGSVRTLGVSHCGAEHFFALAVPHWPPLRRAQTCSSWATPPAHEGAQAEPAERRTSADSYLLRDSWAASRSCVGPDRMKMSSPWMSAHIDAAMSWHPLSAAHSIVLDKHGSSGRRAIDAPCAVRRPSWSRASRRKSCQMRIASVC
eukprot:scaffold94512_cov31-Tisochrysis_lutea.AAC.2